MQANIKRFLRGVSWSTIKIKKKSSLSSVMALWSDSSRPVPPKEKKKKKKRRELKKQQVVRVTSRLQFPSSVLGVAREFYFGKKIGSRLCKHDNIYIYTHIYIFLLKQRQWLVIIRTTSKKHQQNSDRYICKPRNQHMFIIFYSSRAFGNKR